MNTLKVDTRQGGTKGESKKLRRAGMIPAIVYSRGQVGENIAISNAEYSAVVRSITPGSLPTTIFTLDGGKEKGRKAIVKGIQYHVTTYDVLHLDFEELHDDVAVNVKVPLECIGVADCVGIKLGGALRQMLRHAEVRCLPKDMPRKFEFDVRNLDARQSLRIRDLVMPNGVKALAKPEEIAVTIAKR